MFNDKIRNCPICNRQIDAEVCYEIVMCLTAGFNVSSVPEIQFKNDKITKDICDKCPYSNLE